VVTDEPAPQFRDDGLGGRPHQRESALTRDADAKVRAFVLATFPATLVLLWPLVESPACAMFLLSVVWIVLANAAGYVVPWTRFPRWLELLPPMSTIVALTFLVAPAGGLAHGYGLVLMVPMLWVAIYGDLPDIAIGFALTVVCLLLPLDSWFDYLPEQGSPRQTAFFIVHVVVVVIGIRPVINPLRDQIGRNRRAMAALHASQATLVHDLRNPLSAVRSLAMLTQQRVEFGNADDPAFRTKIAEYAGVIVSSTDRAEQIIQGVLEISRAGEQLPWIDTINLPRLIDEVAAGVPGVRIDTSRTPRQVVGHEPSIARLFANLLDNAARHAHDQDGGEAGRVLVTVTGREEPAGWELTVADDGRGIDPDEVDTLFEPWRRGSEVEASGSGLGLAIAEGIVAQHGGTISAANAEPTGASFTFTLARRPSVATQASEQHTPATA
jgi:signal transduction histidine kinase